MLEVKTVRWSEQDRASISAFLAACRGTAPDVTALDALDSLLCTVEDADMGFRDKYPIIPACRALLDGLRAAQAQAEGADDA